MGHEESAVVRRRKGAVLSYVNSIVSLVVGLIYVPILLNGIGRDEYGLYQLVGSMMGYMTILNGVLSAGTTRFYCAAFASGDQKRMQSVLATCRFMYRWAFVVLVVAIVVVIAVFPLIYADSLGASQIVECNVMLALLTLNLGVTMMNSVYVAVINANEEFVFLKATSLANSLLQPMLVIVVIHFAPYAVSVASVLLCLNVGVALVQNHYARIRLGAAVMGKCDKGLLRAITVFMGSLLVALVADQIFWRTNQLVVGYYFGAGAVAVYGVGAQVYTSYLSLGNAMTSVFMPRVSALCNDGRMDEVSALFTKVGRLSLYVLLTIYGGFAVFGRDFIELWAGEGYEESYWVALAIMTAFTLDSSQSMGITILQVLDKYKFRAAMYFVLACVDIAVVMVLAPHIGVVGCAVVSAIMMIIGNGPIMNVYYSKVIGLDIRHFWSNAIRIGGTFSVVTIVASLGWTFLPVGHGWGELAAGILFFVLLTTSACWFSCMNSYEKGLLAGTVRKMLHRLCRTSW